MFDGTFSAPSVKHLLQYFVAPIATKLVDVDEDLLPHVPRGWLPVMTIHQSKGLEFPIVIVDVGSGNGQEVKDFLRFPKNPSTAHNDEDLVGPFSPMRSLRLGRSGATRARDDLKRQYFVSYSRAQSVLLLIGNTAFIRSKKALDSIQVGSRYDGSRCWSFQPAAQVRSTAQDIVALI
jgi:DNA helicase II / ATP-dependent DNA helicase PcrA